MVALIFKNYLIIITELYICLKYYKLGLLYKETSVHNHKINNIEKTSKDNANCPQKLLVLQKTHLIT